ncbi:hypothetical protein [Actinacidiphila sp. ITFR-21]|uniref:hypothetical protein n=1 Tax=Actinacidiphila sp. ITFR-21 TaxID=3075199 RepID=UPI00288B27FC|nr:hypothetical protein [Streptomyces sp. ITFR-21]WNI19215.1 hypothetical protein RLT57_29170 [Streptomyces sp. ITFR-21]
MNAALIRARDAMTAQGFTEHEAVALLLPIIGAAYREVADEANESAKSPSVWGDTPEVAFSEFAAAFRKQAYELDPPVEPDLRGGFWPGMTGGMCARCHLAVNRGDDADPEHEVCVVIADGMRITSSRPDEVLLHLPYWTYWDTQAYSTELGIPAGHLPALKAVIDAWLAQQAVDAAKDNKEPTP